MKMMSNEEISKLISDNPTAQIVYKVPTNGINTDYPYTIMSGYIASVSDFVIYNDEFYEDCDRLFDDWVNDNSEQFSSELTEENIRAIYYRDVFPNIKKAIIIELTDYTGG